MGFGGFRWVWGSLSGSCQISVFTGASKQVLIGPSRFWQDVAGFGGSQSRQVLAGLSRSQWASVGLGVPGQVLMALSRSWWILAGLDGSWQVSVDLFVSRGDLGWPQWVLVVLVDLNIYQELGKCILKFSVRGMSRLSFKQNKKDAGIYETKKKKLILQI